jgi:biotin carboxyl carrier protein
MKLEIDIRGRKRTLEIERPAGASGRGLLLCRLDGRPLEADAVEVATGVYSILLGGRALEVRVQPAETTGGLRIHVAGEELAVQVFDPRAWRSHGRGGGALAAEGRQQVVAPMPGKVIRVLVCHGEAVEAGQGLLVVEAMKMQNEIRSPKSGTVERVMVAEGQAVNAGEPLAVVS